MADWGIRLWQCGLVEHVLDQQVEAARPKVSEVCARGRGSAVTALIESGNDKTCRSQSLDEVK